MAVGCWRSRSCSRRRWCWRWSRRGCGFDKFICTDIRCACVARVAVKIIGKACDRGSAALDLRCNRWIDVQEVCTRASGAQERRILAKRCRVPGCNGSRRKHPILICRDRLRRAGAIRINEMGCTWRSRVKIIVVGSARVITQSAGGSQTAAVRYRQPGSTLNRSVDNNVVPQVKYRLRCRVV